MELPRLGQCLTHVKGKSFSVSPSYPAHSCSYHWQPLAAPKQIFPALHGLFKYIDISIDLVQTDN